MVEKPFGLFIVATDTLSLPAFVVNEATFMVVVKGVVFKLASEQRVKGDDINRTRLLFIVVVSVLEHVDRPKVIVCLHQKCYNFSPSLVGEVVIPFDAASEVTVGSPCRSLSGHVFKLFKMARSKLVIVSQVLCYSLSVEKFISDVHSVVSRRPGRFFNAQS